MIAALAGRSRDEHLARAKAHAVDHLDAGMPEDAIKSLYEDLCRHPAWRRDVSLEYAAKVALAFTLPRGAEAVRQWIEGFG